MGGWIGGQADYVMVPFADFNLLRLGRDSAQAMDKILVSSMRAELERRAGFPAIPCAT
jgi:glutathione-independent formaldehyde dehydrogenase